MYKDIVNDFLKDCMFIKLNKSRSEEYYFGESNPLKDKLISWVNSLREFVKTASEDKPNFAPKDALPICRQMSESLSRILIEEFNIEGAKIGWINEINASCWCHLGNSDLYGKSKDAKDTRIRLNDIVDTKNGFKYKNKKGIYYVIMLGYPIFAMDDIFTAGEAAACLVHELGHAMQHVVTSLNQTAALSVYESVYKIYNTSFYKYSDQARNEINRTLIKLRKAFDKGDQKEIEKLGNELYEESNKDKEGRSYSQLTNDELQGMSMDENPDWDSNMIKVLDNAKQTAKRERGSLFHGIKNLFKSLFGLVLSPIYAIMISSQKNKNANGELNKFKQFEETADNFAQIYGLGVETVSLQKKFNEMRVQLNTNSSNILSRVPLLDLTWSLDSLKDDYYSALCGYPSSMNRALNIYKAAKYELANNKDLSLQAKQELNNQIEQYKKFYDEFVKLNSSKGFFYRIISGISRKNIEKAASKDKTVYDLVLKPLQKRSDPNFNPDSDNDIIS